MHHNNIMRITCLWRGHVASVDAWAVSLPARSKHTDGPLKLYL